MSFPSFISFNMINLTTENITTLINNASGLITDLLPLILIIMGVFLGMEIVASLISKKDNDIK
ncbi:MAG: hypothetical protein PHX19_03885 [Bacilli bacterium]|nr:hypothetical protein [Bacilli bacterium]